MLSVFGGEGFQGEALAFYEGERNRAASIFSEYPLKERYALIKGNRKLIQSERGKELYDLLDDPNEKRDLTESRRQGLDSKSVLQELHAELTEIVEGNKALSVVVNKEHKQELLDEETLERLRALGYIK
jgi:hypothetical protein